jgi:predicted RNase H-like nuclease (RuvC/YqgF family)
MSEDNPNLDNPMGCKPLWSLQELSNLRLQYQADYNERLSLKDAIEDMGPRFPKSIDDAVNIIVRQRHTIRISSQYNASQMDKLNLRISDAYSLIAKQQDELAITKATDSLKHNIIEGLRVELDEAKKAEEVQFQAKWSALTKLDDYQDAIDQLRAENEKLTASNDRLRRVVEANDNTLWNLKQDLDNWSEKAEED